MPRNSWRTSRTLSVGMETVTSPWVRFNWAPIHTTSGPAAVLCHASGKPAAEAHNRATPDSRTLEARGPATTSRGSST
eukprot:5008902-Alexandrium_andersonii.AAC.1